MENNKGFAENQGIRKRIENILGEEEFEMLSESWRQIDDWYFNKLKISNSVQTEEKLQHELENILVDKDRYDSFTYRRKDFLEEILIDIEGINYLIINSNPELYHQYQMLVNMDYLYISTDNIININLHQLGEQLEKINIRLQILDMIEDKLL